ncbi:MAG: response regulator [Candidatus Omnitrophota bacterium]|nr:response regulator [Candidatus Omnitrophota bacterium]
MIKEPLTTGQVAEYCHVTYRAVLKWIAEGKLKAYRTPGQHSRVGINDFLDFLEKYRMPIPQGLERVSLKKKVLIVDDDRRIVQLVRKTLETDTRYDINVAYDGFSAGRIFSSFHPDLVVLDIKMPGVDGYEVCAHIRGDPANKDVKIIAVSGSFASEGEDKMLQAGANVCVAKPFDVEELKKKIDTMLE